MIFLEHQADRVCPVLQALVPRKPGSSRSRWSAWGGGRGRSGGGPHLAAGTGGQEQGHPCPEAPGGALSPPGSSPAWGGERIRGEGCAGVRGLAPSHLPQSLGQVGLSGSALVFLALQPSLLLSSWPKFSSTLATGKLLLILRGPNPIASPSHFRPGPLDKAKPPFSRQSLGAHPSTTSLSSVRARHRSEPESGQRPGSRGCGPGGPPSPSAAASGARGLVATMPGSPGFRAGSPSCSRLWAVEGCSLPPGPPIPGGGNLANGAPTFSRPRPLS